MIRISQMSDNVVFPIWLMKEIERIVYPLVVNKYLIKVSLQRNLHISQLIGMEVVIRISQMSDNVVFP